MNKLSTFDLGSTNIKTNLGGIYENRFILDNESDTFGAETLEFEGNTYFFNRGNFNKEFTKANKEIEIPLLYAIGKEGLTGNINSILHLPASQFAMRQQIIDRLQGKTFKFKVNGIDNEITFDKVGVLKEGFAAFYSLPKRNNGLIAIVDIGGRTTDVFTFVNGKEEKETSIPVGTMNYFKIIADRLNSEGENRKIEDIFKLIDNGLIDLEDYKDATDSIGSLIINEIKIEVENLKDYSIKLCGGGADYFKEAFEEKYKNVEVLNNNLLSNVAGSHFIGKAKGLD